MMLSCEVARMHEDIAADPPDPNFATVQPPVFSTLTPSGQPASDALAEALDRQAAYGIATRIVYERYQGAVEAGDAAAQQRQLDAAGEFAFALADAMRTTADALRAAAASTEPAVEGIPVRTPEALAGLRSMARRVTTDGFTAAETAQLEALGATAEDIVNARTWFDRAFDITPGASLDTLLVEVADGFDASVGATDAFARHVSAVVVPVAVNRPPVVADDAATVAEDGSTTIAVLANDDDPDGDTLTASVTSGPAHGTAVNGPAGVAYTPAPNFSGTDTFTYRADDGRGGTATATVSVTVEPLTGSASRIRRQRRRGGRQHGGPRRAHQRRRPRR